MDPRNQRQRVLGQAQRQAIVAGGGHLHTRDFYEIAPRLLVAIFVCKACSSVHTFERQPPGCIRRNAARVGSTMTSLDASKQRTSQRSLTARSNPGGHERKGGGSFNFEWIPTIRAQGWTMMSSVSRDGEHLCYCGGHTARVMELPGQDERCESQRPGFCSVFAAA